jgi:predicted class III extradiol MEMO1 family dioxygenase
MEMKQIKKALFAGSFYPKNPNEIEVLIEHFNSILDNAIDI